MDIIHKDWLQQSDRWKCCKVTWPRILNKTSLPQHTDLKGISSRSRKYVEEKSNALAETKMYQKLKLKLICIENNWISNLEEKVKKLLQWKGGEWEDNETLLPPKQKTKTILSEYIEEN